MLMYSSAVIEPTSEHKATLIWFHGLDGSAADCAQQFEPHRNPHIKYIFPQSPRRKVTLTGSEEPIAAWFNLFGLDGKCEEDVEGIADATGRAHLLIDYELSLGTPANRIFVGGFSMGGAFAMHVAWHYSATLAGAISCSGYLLNHRQFPGEADMNRDIPFYLAHGTADTVVVFVFGEISSQIINGYAKNLTFKRFENLGHETNKEELHDVQQFINSHL